MKKIRVFSILLLLISTTLFVAFLLYTKKVKDNHPPVVTCETEELEVSVKDPASKLLEGVTAEDKRNGDVTDTLVIEDMSSFTNEGTRVITYAAVDDSKNVGRCERELHYSDYEKPRFYMNQALCFPVGGTVKVFEVVGAESSLDGDLSGNIKYTLRKMINTMEEGTYPIEFRVMDSAGEMVYLDAEVEILSRELSTIEVYLKEHLIYIKKDSSFDPKDYYEGASKEGNLTIKSKVDTKEPGTYYVDYIVKDNAVGGKSRMIVVVE